MCPAPPHGMSTRTTWDPGAMGLDTTIAVLVASVGAGLGLPLAMAWVERAMTAPRKPS